MSVSVSRNSLSLSARREGFLVGAVIGSALAASTADCTDLTAIRERLTPSGRPRALAPIPGQRRAATALADGLLEELLAGGVDLHRLSHRWVEWWRADGADADPLAAAALDHLRDFDAPIVHLGIPGTMPIAAALPSALASASPRSMIAGAFHVARLLDPAEEAGLAAVATVVAAAGLLEGRRDVVPDVLSMLLANDAPEEMLVAVRAVPRNPGQAPAVPRHGAPPAAVLAWVLWLVAYQPRSAEALTMMVLAGGVDPSVGAALGALLGARDGIADWPAEWLEEAGEEVTLRSALARQLAGE
jgi:ADP-ribosylglycohydrolase